MFLFTGQKFIEVSVKSLKFQSIEFRITRVLLFQLAHLECFIGFIKLFYASERSRL